MSPLPRPWPQEGSETISAAPQQPSVRLVETPPSRATREDAIALAKHCIRFRDAKDSHAWRELLVTLALYIGFCGALIVALSVGFWPGLVLAIPGGMMIVRLFTIQHDCGHGSFFTSRDMNRRVGRIMGLFTFTPYDAWRRAHTMHHASSGDLGRRGIGDVDTLTIAEYEALTPLKRLGYRIYRHPLVLHVIGPPIYFLILQRIPFWQALPPKTIWRSVMGLNVALVAFYGTLGMFVGSWETLVAGTLVASVASWVGAWLFYVQHQFEDTHWSPSEEWNAGVAALNGSSHYALPGWVNWLTGHIGLHHIHHLNARVPSYRLRECMEADSRLGALSRLSFAESFRCIGLGLWDEDAKRLVSFARAS